MSEPIPSCIKRRTRKNVTRAGFGVAPILYMLGLIGVGAGVLFTSYSQGVRNNLALSNNIEVRNDLEASASTLSATSLLSSDGTVLCPPSIDVADASCPSSLPIALEAIPSSTDPRVPGFASGSDLQSYVLSGGTTPDGVGVFAAAAGLNQVDPWGHFYIVCRWKPPVTAEDVDNNDPAFQIISGGPKGIVETKCGEAPTAVSGNYSKLIDYYDATHRASVWQVTGLGTSSQLAYSATGVSVDSGGNMKVPGKLKLAALGTTAVSLNNDNGYLNIDPGNIELTGNLSVTTGEVKAARGIFTAALAAATGSGASFVVNPDGSVSSGGTLTVSPGGSSVLSVKGTETSISNATKITGLLTLGSSGATTTTGLNTFGPVHIGTTVDATGISLSYLSVGKLGAGDVYPFSVDQAGVVTAAMGTFSTLSSGGSYTSGGEIKGASADVSGKVTSGELDTSGAAEVTGNATIGGVLYVNDLVVNGTASGNIATTSTADLTTAEGILAVAHGGTGAGTVPAGVNNLGRGNANYLTTGTLVANLLPTLSPNPSGGPYDEVYVDSHGRVTSGHFVVWDSLSDSVGDSITLDENVITFTINYLIKGLWNSAGLTVGTSTPPRTVLDLGNDAGAVVFPVGSTAERPVPPAFGMIRYNTTKLAFEGYQSDPGEWATFITSAGSGGGGVIASFNGVCGTANGQVLSATPTSANMCASGIVGTLVGTGNPTWAWSCLGIGSGTTASCSASAQKIDGSCGSDAGLAHSTTPINLCASGTVNSFSSNSAQWAWNCVGAAGGTSSVCSAYQNGVCNVSLSNVPIPEAPTAATGCTQGAFGNFSAVGATIVTYTWTCYGGGIGATVSCTATQGGNGICGTAHGGYSKTIPSGTAACAQGTVEGATGSKGIGWTWSCLPEGVGSTASCSATANCFAGGPGSPCLNDQVYVGMYSNSIIYTTPCDAGQTATWDNNVGYTCSGTRSTISWGGSCSFYGGGNACSGTKYGSSDWYVPDLPRLNMMCTNGAAIGNFSGAYYRSTTYAGGCDMFNNNTYWMGQACPGTATTGINGGSAAVFRCYRADSFTFGAVTGQPLSTVVLSSKTMPTWTGGSTLAVTANNCTIQDSNCGVRCNGAGGFSTSCTVGSGQTVEVQQMTSSSFGTATIANVTVGAMTATFTATTVNTATLSFAAQTGVAMNTAVTASATPTWSGGGTLTATVNACTIADSNCSVSCNGSAYATSCTLTSGQTLSLRQTSASTMGTTNTASVTVGSTVATYNATTVTAAVTDFLFPAQTGVPLSTATISTAADTPTWTGGGSLAATVDSCTGSNCAVSCNGGAYASSCALTTGQSLIVRQTTSSSSGVETQAVVTLGNKSVTFRATTMTSDPCSGSPAIGTVCLDGSVYAGITPDGDQPMYAMPCDYGMTAYWINTTKFSCTGTRISSVWGPSGVTTGFTSLVSGKIDTAGLAALGSSYAPMTACVAQTYAGHTDWYLPALYEAEYMCTGTTTAATCTLPSSIGGLLVDGNWYWTSSEVNSANAYMIRFNEGYQYSYPKTYASTFTRCVRTPSQTSFAFTAIAGQALSTAVTSTALPAPSWPGGNALTATVSCSVSDSNCGVRCNGSGGYSPSCTLESGQSLQVQQTTSSSFGTKATAAVSLGGLTVDFDATTVNTSNVFSFTAQTGLAQSSTATSSTVTPTWAGGGTLTATAVCTVSDSVCGVSCAGGAYASSCTLTTGQTLTARQTTSSSYGAITLATVTVGSTSANFSATTVTTTADFLFVSQTDVPLGAMAISTASAAPTWSGGGALTATVSSCSGTNCLVSCNGGAYAASCSLTSGQSLIVRQTVSSNANTTTVATATLGDKTATFSATTMASDPCAGTLSLGLVCADGTVYGGQTTDGYQPMFAMPCDMGMLPYWVGSTAFTCAGTRNTYAYGVTGTTTLYSYYANRPDSEKGKLATAGLVALGASFVAANTCVSQTYGGHTDWYLPSVYEIEIMCSGGTTINPGSCPKIASIGGFLTNGSWYDSSTDYYTEHTDWNFVLRLSDGTWSNTGKTTGYYLRCVRSSTQGSFGFPSAIGQAVNAVVTSTASPAPTWSEAGSQTASVTCSVSDSNCGVQCNGSGGYASSCVLSSGQSLQVRQTTASAYATKNTASVKLGAYTATFDATTVSLPTFSYAALVGQALNTAVTASATPTWTGGGTLTATVSCSVSDSNCGVQCNGTGGYVSSCALTTGQTLQVQQTTLSSYGTAAIAAVTLGGTTANFSATTVASPTNSINFVAVTNAPLNTATMASTALAPTWSGGGTLTASISNCTSATCLVSCNGGAYAATCSLTSGQSLAVQQTSSGSVATVTEATVSLGGLTGLFRVKTMTSDPCTGSPSVGTVCLDGSVYAGKTQDGNQSMYAMPCDYSFTALWTGSAFTCMGTRASTTVWGPSGVTTGYASLTTGKLSTIGLAALGAGYVAANSCTSQTYGGHTDWYLPAQYELQTMCNGTIGSGVCSVWTTIGNFATSGGGYYTSTESSSANAIYIPYSSGVSTNLAKTTWEYIRCIRSNQGSFVFAAITAQPINTVVTSVASPAPTWSGGGALTATLSSCSGSGCGIRCNGAGGYVSTCTLYSGQSLEVQQTTSSSYGTTTTANVSLGVYSASFSATTIASPSALSFTALTGQAPNTVVTASATPTWTGGGAQTATVTSCTGTNCGVQCNGAGGYVSSCTLTTGQTLQVQQTTGSGYGATTTVNVTLGSQSAGFSATTVNTPNPISFESITNAPLNVPVIRSVTAVPYWSGGGTLTATVDSCTGTNCLVSCNGGSYAASCTLSTNQTLYVQLTSSAASGTQATATVSLGSRTATFSATTVTSDACASSPTRGTTCANGTVYAGVPPDGNKAMYATPCDMGQTGAWNGSGWTCLGTRGTYVWSASTVSTGYTNTSMGHSNTAGLVSTYGSTYAAAYACYNLSYGGQTTGWYLPASDELSAVANYRSLIPNFIGSSYYTSTETAASTANYIDFSTGYKGVATKTGALYVRCILGGMFSFLPQTGLAVNTAVTATASPVPAWTGGTTKTATLTSCTGTNCGVQCNGTGGYTSSCSLTTGQSLQVQQTTSSSIATKTTAIVTLGDTTTSFNATTVGISGVCGTANGAYLLASPTGTAACSAGTSSAVAGGYGSGYTWSCLPVGDGSTANCSATNPSQCATGAVGTVCSDGTVYAGPTPENGYPMFAMPCDLGMTGTLNGSSYTCSGTRSLYQWGAYGTKTGYNNSYTGEANTYGLVAAYGSGVSAAYACRTQTYGGYNDWYLPADFELTYMCNGTTGAGTCTRATAINNLLTGSNDYYWSSTEIASTVTVARRFSDASSVSDTKTRSLLVRCIRK